MQATAVRHTHASGFEVLSIGFFVGEDEDEIVIAKHYNEESGFYDRDFIKKAKIIDRTGVIEIQG